MKKRVLSLALAICMCLAVLPDSAFAAENENGMIWLEEGMYFQEQDSCFHDGLAPVRKQGVGSGYIDETGEVVIPLIYEWAENFSEGLATVRKDGKCGVIDTTGKVIVPFEYHFIYPFSAGRAVLYKEVPGGRTQWGVIDSTGNFIYPLTWDIKIGPFSEGLACVSIGGRTSTYINEDGKEVFSIECSNAYEFHEGLAQVRTKDGKTGFIDKTGTLVIPYLDYSRVDDFRCGVAQVVKNENGESKVGFIDKTGKVVIPLGYDYIFPFFEGVARFGTGFEKDDVWGLIDTTGKVVVPKMYSWMGNCREGLVPVEYDGKWGFIDKTGKTIVPPIYGHVEDFDNGYALVNNKGIYGIIDNTGDLIVPIQYDFMPTAFNDGIWCAGATGRHGFIDVVKVATARRTAVPSRANTTIDGKAIQFAAYSLQDTTYIKLRDVAAALSGSEAQFDVGWDGAKSTITLTTGKAYTTVGGELSNQTLEAQVAHKNTATVLLDGKEVSLEAFTIGGNNYFKLRDLGYALGFNVSWDKLTGSIVINTNEPYTDDISVSWDWSTGNIIINTNEPYIDD